MKIAGLQPFSLTDFPGRVAGILFTAGCNWACSYCHNKGLWKDECALIPEKEIFSFLESRKEKLDGIVVTGGEPTIQEDLIEFIEKIRSYGYLVKLDTNGTAPDKIIELLDKRYLDYIAMDIKAPFEKYPLIVGKSKISVETLKESIGVIASSGVKHEFRTTFTPHLLEQEDIDIIKTYIPKGSFYRIQEYVKGKDRAALLKA